MRILIVVPSPAHKQTAGSRIRYDRLAAPGEGLLISVEALGELKSEAIEACDVVVLSKTYSVAAIAVAERAAGRGKVVGIDLFDDYFSADDDARLTRFRAWLGRFGGSFDFALCSTATMRRTIAHFAPGLPVLIVPDAYPEIDPVALGDLTREKRHRALETGQIDVVWFGIGSNPLFSVGLRDLAAFSWALDAVARRPFDVRLTIVTDDASQQTRQLAGLRRLSLPYEIRTWSLEVEAEALDEALVAFIPVNGQSFSRAKSLNRALTAISAGTQVLSPGYPLYADLGEAIYQDGADIVPDLLEDRLRIRPETVAATAERAGEVSALSTVVSDLYVFLNAQVRAKSRSYASSGRGAGGEPSCALVVSQDADRDMTVISRNNDILSVRGPFSGVERVFDVRINALGGRALEVWVRKSRVRFLAEGLRGRCSAPQAVGKAEMVKVDTTGLDLLERPLPAMPGKGWDALLETATFEAALVDVENACRRLFPELRIFTSDIRAYTRRVSTRALATEAPR